MIKSQKGITLVALVVTIIVLLILAVVSISAVLGDNGIVTKAQKAKEKTAESAAYEAIDLVIGEWSLAEIAGNKTLEEYLNSKVTVGALDSVTKDDEKQIFILEKDGYTRIMDMVIEPKVGDYVNYTPAGTAYTTSYNVEAKYSGYSSDQLVYQQDTKWRILEINAAEIVLIAEDNLGIGSTAGNTTKLFLHGGDGYNNGVDLLNITCETLYSNNSIGAVARSIRQSDLDKHSTYDKTSYSYVGGAYGDTFEATNRYTPALFLAENICNNNTSGYGREDNVGLGSYSGASSQSTSILIQEPWYRFSNYCEDEVYLELLGDNDYFWTATRSVTIDNDSGTGTNIYPFFSVGKYSLLDDKYGPCSQSFLLKPIVEISGANLTRDIETTIDGYNCWDL